ncbi:hypothetical protein AVEN_12020-1 [Araneus ventricosus]|uniref:Mos1 transposase HTH domain-containing protein n=1 Tax=Araneus ventricosus TaxID=182803 RepID=A0A4Y2G3Y2_ARAVE|nr:hypothetical protein AVEN_12020-1 [Araneus ventricosus]
MNLKFLYKLGKLAGQSHRMLEQVYGEDTVILKTLYTWFKKFIDGLESIEDKHRCGQPTTADNVCQHNTTLVRWFLPQIGVTELSHAPTFPRPVTTTLFPVS